MKYLMKYLKSTRVDMVQDVQKLEKMNIKVNTKKNSKIMSNNGLVAKGNPYDNAVMESFYRTLKKSLLEDLIMIILNKLNQIY